MYDVALLEAGAVRALDLVHHVPRDLRVEGPLQHHLRLGVPRVDGEVVETPILKSELQGISVTATSVLLSREAAYWLQ